MSSFTREKSFKKTKGKDNGGKKGRVSKATKKVGTEKKRSRETPLIPSKIRAKANKKLEQVSRATELSLFYNKKREIKKGKDGLGLKRNGGKKRR